MKDRIGFDILFAFLLKNQWMWLYYLVKPKKFNWALLVICYSLLAYDDPIRLLAGKPESRNARMLREHRTIELPSLPEADRYKHKI